MESFFVYQKDSKIREIFKPDILRLIKNQSFWNLAKGYFNNSKKLFCAYCKQKIEDVTLPDHFLLWTPDNKYNIVFHDRCAIKDSKLIPISDNQYYKDLILLDRKYSNKTSMYSFPSYCNYFYDFKTNRFS